MFVGKNTPCLFWPFVAVWRLVVGIVRLVGRLIAFLIGISLLVGGFLVTLTVVGSVIGIPLMIAGLLLMIRSLF